MIIGGFFYFMEEKVLDFNCVSQYGSRNKSYFSSCIDITYASYHKFQECENKTLILLNK